VPQTDPFAAYRVQASPQAASQPQASAPATADPFAAYRVQASPASASEPQRTHYTGSADRKPAATEDFVKPGWPATLGDVGIGFAKGVGSFVANTVGEGAANAGLIPGAQPAAFNADMRNPVFRRAEEALTATNTAQKVGKGLEMAAEIALPVGAGGKAAVEAIPTATRAAGKFQEVMSAARHVPIDITGPGDVALRISELAERGGSMPMAVNKFLRRVTDPEKPAMAYEEARDFASNISRLSANEFQRLTPAVAREVAGLRVALNKAVGDAAAKAGKGREYAEAMSEYAKAKRLHGIIDDVVTGAKKALPYAGAAAAGTWLTKQAMSLLGGD
jgi:hypothetical protein